jgi:gliding motility-associated-like protein
MKKLLSLIVLVLIGLNSFSQRGKDGDYTTTNPDEILNAYTEVTSNVTVGATTVQVANNDLTSSFLTNPLAQGDLIMIIQMQGAVLNIDQITISWGGTYTWPDDFSWGTVTNIENAGNYEFAEVLSVAGSNQITLTCPLTKAYTSSNHTQIVRIPRLNNLTVDHSITSAPWDGTVGGIVSLEVLNDATINSANGINTDEKGFRGAILGDNVSTNASSESTTGKFGNINGDKGAEKGEGVGGFTTEYTALNSLYQKGAPANGGGGGNNHNAGGGGGANAGLGTYTGTGVPVAGYNDAWNEESTNFAFSSSPGGGRGGYTHSASNQDAAFQGPNNDNWGGDFRRNEGGLGGEPMDYSTGKIFLGGGGGGGDQNNNEGGNGGNGGGIVFLNVYGDVLGSGSITSTGQDGFDAVGPVPPSGQKTGDDGAGGAGAGGTIIINSKNAVATTLSMNADGGNGGVQNLQINCFGCDEAAGPGGGGGGGYIAISSGTPTRTVNGGVSGTTTSSQLSEFPPNGATNGGLGIGNASIPHHSIAIRDTVICGGGSVDLTVDLTGTLPGGTSIGWYTQPFGGSSFNSGLTYTTPNLAVTTTYYIGMCPGNYRIPVVISISPALSIDETNLVIAPVTCAGNDGSITGIVASGGFGTLDFEWNSTASVDEDLSNVGAGDYTLVVTDENGCDASSGPHTIGSSGGPVLDTTNHVIVASACDTDNGSISGITATGTGLTYEWNGNPSATLDIANLAVGSYSLVVEDVNGCQVSTGIYVIENTADPVIDISSITNTDANCGLNDGSIADITVTGLGGYVYEWDGSVSATIDIASLSPGNHELIVTDLNGCDDTVVVNVGQDLDPTINTTGMTITPTDCDTDNGSISGITGNGNAPFTFEWESVNQGTDSLLNGVGAGDYTIVVFDAGGCSDTLEDITVSQVSDPVIDASGITVTPTGCTTDNGSIADIVTTSVNAGVINFEWNTNDNGTTSDIGSLGTGFYDLVAIDGAGCTDTLYDVEITQANGPVIDASNIVITNTDCTVDNGSIAGITANSPNGGITYEWNGVDNGVSADINGLGVSLNDLVALDAQGCSDTLYDVAIATNSGPTIDVTNLVITPDNCGLCIGEINGLQITGGATPYDVQWSNSATTLDIADLCADSYDLTVVDDAGCEAILNGNVIINQGGINIDDANLLVTNESCIGADGSISGLAVTGGTGTLVFDWDNSALTTLDLINLIAGGYTLTVTDDVNCTETYGPILVDQDVGVTADFSYTPSAPLVDDVIQFNDQSSGTILTWEWDFNSESISSDANPTYSFTTSGIYPVELIVSDGTCSDTIIQNITVVSGLNVPNVITPNEDNINDVFDITGLQPNTSLSIRNRWGNVVYETVDYQNDWMGDDLSGKRLSPGTYFYVLENNGELLKQGFVVLRITD